MMQQPAVADVAAELFNSESPSTLTAVRQTAQTNEPKRHLSHRGERGNKQTDQTDEPKRTKANGPKKLGWNKRALRRWTKQSLRITHQCGYVSERCMCYI
jgi:hypothetical protein